MNLDHKILAGMMDNESFLNLSLTKLSSEYFDGNDKIIFEGIKKMYSDRKEINTVNVMMELKNFVPIDYLATVTVAPPLRTHYASLLAGKIESHFQSNIADYAVELHKNAKTMSLEDLSGQLTEKVDKIQEAITPTKERDMKDILKDTLAEIDEASKSDGIMGYQTGYRDMDRVFHGLKKGELIVLAGRPAMGKTTMATEIARNGVKLGQKVLFFTMEMGDTELAKKLIASEAEIDHDSLISGNLSTEGWQRVNTASGKLLTDNLKVYEKGGINELELANVARKQKREKGVDLIIIDYLQIMTCSDAKKEANLNLKAGYLSGQIKALAMELECPIILLSQLSRAVETRGGDCRPIPSDLRDSGSIEQDANMLWFVYRPEVYNIETLEDGTDTQNYMEVIVSKNRRGRTGVIPLRCRLNQSRINNFE
jgi:replicative DNA helicase